MEDTNSILAASQITALPPSFHYIPSFISHAEEAALLDKIAAQPWIYLSHRSLQVYPAQLSSTNVLLAAKALPQWLTDPIFPRLAKLDVFAEQQTPHRAPNHVLVNRYLPGQGIMPHEDGPAYGAVTATVSLGSSVVLEIYEEDSQGNRCLQPTWRILQEPRSLLVTCGKAYEDLIHGITEAETDENLGEEGIVNWSLLGEPEKYVAGKTERGERVSLTIRDVVKVSRLGSKIFGR